MPFVQRVSLKCKMSRHPKKANDEIGNRAQTSCLLEQPVGWSSPLLSSVCGYLLCTALSLQGCCMLVVSLGRWGKERLTDWTTAAHEVLQCILAFSLTVEAILQFIWLKVQSQKNTACIFCHCLPQKKKTKTKTISHLTRIKQEEGFNVTLPETGGDVQAL